MTERVMPIKGAYAGPASNHRVRRGDYLRVRHCSLTPWDGVAKFASSYG